MKPTVDTTRDIKLDAPVQMSFDDFESCVTEAYEDATHIFLKHGAIYALTSRGQVLVGCLAGVVWPLDQGRVYHIEAQGFTGRIEKYMPYGADTYCGRYLKNEYLEAQQQADVLNMMDAHNKAMRSRDRDERRAQWKNHSRPAGR